MALSFCDDLHATGKIAIWQIEESTQFYCDFLDIAPSQVATQSNATHPQKQLEWLASRTCLKYLCQAMRIPFTGVSKDQHNNPSLLSNTAQISITHTDRYVACGIDTTQAIGLDIEKVSTKFLKVKHKYLHPDEQHSDDLQALCVYWCAKESLYKWHGLKNLSFKEHIFIEPFAQNASLLQAQVMPPDHRHSVHQLGVYYIEDYILTTTKQHLYDTKAF